MSERLAEHTTTRVGGPARAWVTARTEAEAVEAVRAADAAGEPVFVLGGGPDVAPGACTGLPPPPGATVSRLANGLQIFAGGVPIYRGSTLVGALGISGDGIDQDDMTALLAVDRHASRNGGLANAPAQRRADRLQPAGVRLRYVQCPYAPFLGSNAQNVCAGK